MGSYFPASGRGSYLCRTSWFFSSHKHLQPSNVLPLFTGQANVASLWISSDLEKEDNYPGGLYRMNGIMGSPSTVGARTDWWGLGLPKASQEIQACTGHSVLRTNDTTHACPASSVGRYLWGCRCNSTHGSQKARQGDGVLLTEFPAQHLAVASLGKVMGGRERGCWRQWMPLILSPQGPLGLAHQQKSAYKPCRLLASHNSLLSRHWFTLWRQSWVYCWFCIWFLSKRDLEQGA